MVVMVIVMIMVVTMMMMMNNGDEHGDDHEGSDIGDNGYGQLGQSEMPLHNLPAPVIK